MALTFSLELAGVPDGDFVDFGPFDQKSGLQARIPSKLTRRVKYPELGVVALVECVFTGDRLEIQSICVQKDEKYLSATALSQLSLPAVVREIALQVVPSAKLWVVSDDNQDQRSRGPIFLAQVYWFEHISWGSPRGSIMKLMNWSRTNANFHISKISREVELPGAHAKPRPKNNK
jgi:hypothetical protein